MKVTKTKTETTMYDTNGKKVSIVRQEILEVDTTRHLLNREEGKQLNEKVTVYKTDLNNAKAIRNQLEKVKGSKKGRQIFHDMADLLMIVDKSKESKVTEFEFNSGLGILKSMDMVTVTRTPNEPSKVHLLWNAANTIYESDTHIKQKMSSKKHKKKH